MVVRGRRPRKTSHRPGLTTGKMGVFFLNFLRALKGPTKNLLLRTTLFFVYLLFGAAVFQTIESGEERREKHHFDIVRQNFKEKYNISEKEMARLFMEISKAVDEGYFDVNYDRWSFAGSLFFTGTVVTTIGEYNLGKTMRNALK